MSILIGQLYSYHSPIVALGATGAGTDLGAETDADIGLGASDDNGEGDGTGSSRIAPPEGETPSRGDPV